MNQKRKKVIKRKGKVKVTHLQLEHVVVEELLKTLVGVVDAQLLERVDLENLKTGDIQDTNEVSLSLLCKGEVDLAHEPQEETSVDGFGEGITGRCSLLGVELGSNEVTSSKNAGLNERLLELRGVAAQEVGSSVEDVLVGDLGALTLSRVEGDVTEVEDGSEGAEDGHLLLRGDAHDGHGISRVLELLGIVHTLDAIALALVEISEVLRTRKAELF